MTTYTTIGNVRGTCGHKHRGLRTAALCVRGDRSGCKAVGGYSDRHVQRTDNERLTDDEMDYVAHVVNG
jgi:hypothetical protein